jgi:hypothetical protein
METITPENPADTKFNIGVLLTGVAQGRDILARYATERLKVRIASDLNKYPLSKEAKEALTQELLDEGSVVFPRLIGYPSTKRKRIRNKLIRKTIKDNARLLLPWYMSKPLRRKLSFSGFARKVFLVEPLPMPEEAVYLPPPLTASTPPEPTPESL